MEVQQLEVWVSASDAAEALGIAPRTLRKRAGNGQVKRRGSGKSVEYRVPASALRHRAGTVDRVPPADPASGAATVPARQSNGRHEPQVATAPASAPVGTATTDVASMNLATQVERLARQVGRLEVELEQTRAELEHARPVPTVMVGTGNASAAEEARIARQSRAQVIEWLQARDLWEAYLDDVLGEDSHR